MESTRTVPVVSAKLPVDGDGADEVIGSFTYRGITYAIEPGGESVAIVAADCSKLPRDFIEAQTIVLPSVVSFDGVDSYGVSRIADGAFSSLTRDAASASEGSQGGSALSDDQASDAPDGVDAPSDASDDGDAASDEYDAPSDASDDDDAPFDAPDEDDSASDAPGEGAGLDSATDEERAFDPDIEDAPSAGIIAITIPASVASIEDDAFAGFETLQYVIVSDDNPNYSMYDGCLYDEPLTSLLLIPEGRLGAVRVPSAAVTIPEDVVSHCAYVTSFIVEPDSAAFSSVDGRLYTKDLSTLICDPTAAREMAINEVCVSGSSGAREAMGVEAQVENARTARGGGPYLLNLYAAAGTFDGGAKSIYVYAWEGSSLPDLTNAELMASWGITNWKPSLAGYDFAGYFIGGKQYYYANGKPAVSSWDMAHDEILGAVYSPITYTISYDVAGGVLANPVNTYNIESNDFNLPTPARDGYVFDGWTVSGSAGSGLAQSGVTTTVKRGTYGNLVCHAKWKQGPYILGLSANGGKYVDGSDAIFVYAYLSNPLPDLRDSNLMQSWGITDWRPSRPGFTFDGFEHSGVRYYNGDGSPAVAVWTYAGDMPMSARWLRNTYSVTYGDNGGTFSGKTTSYNVESPDFKLPTSGTRTGFSFAGWDVSGASGMGIAGNGTADVTIRRGTYGNLAAKAKWTIDIYSVNYEDEGGTFTGKTASYTIETNDFTLPTSGTRTGYTFAGWEVSGASGSGITGNGTTNVTIKKGTYGNLTAKAKWTLNTYHLSWEVAHGTHANRVDDFTVEDCPMAMAAATADAGYTFDGWSGTGIASGSKSFVLSSSMLEGKGNDETFAYTATLSANYYTARLHANDSTDALVEHGVTYDAPVPSASVPKRYGYVFSGYWTKKADGTKGELYFDGNGAYVRDSGIWKGLSDIDLYACWTLMASLEVPVCAPDAVSFALDRTLEMTEEATGTPVGSDVSGALRSSVPQEVPVASIELELLRDGDGTLAAERALGAGNLERCGVEVSFGSAASAFLCFADTAWEPDVSLVIPAAAPVSAGAPGDGAVSDSAGNLARAGELPLTYNMKLLSGFDVLKMPIGDVTNEPVARIVFTVDLTDLAHERF